MALTLGCGGRAAVPLGAGAGTAAGGGSAAAGAAAGEAPAEIEILADVNEVTRPYRQIGFVETQRSRRAGEGPVRVKDLLPDLIERARKLGAHALIELETQPIGEGGAAGLRATAIAIVYTD